MLIPVLRAKIHRVRITDANLNYEGSIAISRDLLTASGIRVYDRVQVVNLNNGERFETYVIEGKPGEVCLNGPAARLGLTGDIVIIISYAYADPATETVTPKIIHVDANNRPL
jgi:aspartate 1-decarboxylase